MGALLIIVFSLTLIGIYKVKFLRFLILVLLSVLSLFGSLYFFSHAKSAIHEIEALIMFLAFAVFLGFAFVIAANEPKIMPAPETEPEPDLYHGKSILDRIGGESKIPGMMI